MRHNFKKKFGQNFLRSEKFVHKLIAPLEINENDIAIEIGPGDGIVTKVLLENGAKVVSIDIDFDVIPKLIKKFEGNENFTIIHEDILKVNLDEVIRETIAKYSLEEFRIFIVGSLPYNISKKIIEKVLEHNSNPEYEIKITGASFIVQDEVAKLYSAQKPKNTFLSVVSRLFSNTKKLESIPPSQFFPKPKVAGGIIYFDLFESAILETKELNDFIKFLKIGFIAPRKTVYNNLKSSHKFDSEILVNSIAEFGEKVRAAEMNLEDWITLYRKLI